MLERTIEEYLQALVARNLSDNTLTIYRSQMRRFDEWLGRVAKHPHDVTYADLTAWSQETQDEISPKTWNHLLAVLRGYYDHQIALGRCLHSPISRVLARRTSHREPSPPLRRRQVQAILQAAYHLGDPWPLVIGVLAGCGPRIDEVCKLERRDFYQAEDARWYLSIIGKGDKERHVPVPQGLADALLRYLEKRWDSEREAPLLGYYHALSRAHIAPETIRYKPRLHALTPGYVRRAIERLRDSLGMDVLTPHMFRRYWATQQISNGIPLGTVQKGLGHSSATTTLHYYAPDDEELNRLGETQVPGMDDGQDL